MPIVSDTGPLISACQSQCLALVASLFGVIQIPSGVRTELVEHGWWSEIAVESRIVVVELTKSEREKVKPLADQIAGRQSDMKRPVQHLGEAEAIVLAQRAAANYDLILLDELAARDLARSFGLVTLGFAGTLLLAVERKIMTPRELKQQLEQCRKKGTHYGQQFIESVYADAMNLWSEP